VLGTDKHPVDTKYEDHGEDEYVVLSTDTYLVNIIHEGYGTHEKCWVQINTRTRWTRNIKIME
jgi:hypothetical protein